MNIPNDGGWGKDWGQPALASGPDSLGEGEGLLSAFPAFWKAFPRDWLILACVALTGTFCFGLGLLVARENQPPQDPLWIEQLPPEELAGSLSTSTASTQATSTEQDTIATPAATPPAPSSTPGTSPQTGTYVASKSGTKYYLPSCASANRIKDENKIWFATKQEAEAAGYQPSTTCKGL